jgi:hypothetical protein
MPGDPRPLSERLDEVVAEFDRKAGLASFGTALGVIIRSGETRYFSALLHEAAEALRVAESRLTGEGRRG